jgi:eukaryotic-like serine/threonine-protein kinase
VWLHATVARRHPSQASASDVASRALRPFSEIAAQLGLAATISADVRSTITPATWAALRHDGDDDPSPRAPASVSSAPTAPPLPRLSIRLPSSEAPPALSEERSSDDLIVRELLAEGGMGRLYVAEQRSLAREVVVKTVRHRGDRAQEQALVAEGTITGALEHPNITPVHLAGLDETGSPMLVMKRIVGVSWSALLEGDASAWERVSGLSRDRARAHLEILMQVASAVHFAHEHGVIHRDIKPDNVMVGRLGEVYVVDWGVAIRQRAGEANIHELVGTPCYVAPEMLAGGPLGPHTDVYLLGATLHVVLTGRVRHEGTRIDEVLEQAWRSEPQVYDDTVPEELAALANAATARDPAERPESALGFRRAIADHLEHVESLRLASDGWWRNEKLRTLRGSAGDVALMRARLVTEARFAFHAALASWPENPRARAGVKACLVEALELELERENLEAARAVASELDDVPAPLVARIAELEALVERRERDAARLLRIEHDTDVNVAAKERTWLLLGLTVFTLVLGAIIVRGGFGTRQLEPQDGATLAFGASAVLGVCIAGVVAFRRALLRNRLNAQLIVLLLGSTALLVVHRVVEWNYGAHPADTLRADLLILAAPCLAAAVFIRRRAAVAAGVLLASFLVAAWVPRMTALVFSVGSALALIGVGWALYHRDSPAPTNDHRPGA